MEIKGLVFFNVHNKLKSLTLVWSEVSSERYNLLKSFSFGLSVWGKYFLFSFRNSDSILFNKVIRRSVAKREEFLYMEMVIGQLGHTGGSFSTHHS